MARIPILYPYEGGSYSIKEFCILKDFSYAKFRVLFRDNERSSLLITSKEYVDKYASNTRKYHNNKYFYGNLEYTKKDLALFSGLSYNTICYRIRNGMSIKDVVEKPLHSRKSGEKKKKPTWIKRILLKLFFKIYD